VVMGGFSTNVGCFIRSANGRIFKCNPDAPHSFPTSMNNAGVVIGAFHVKGSIRTWHGYVFR
jgi:hypothetical protein